MMKIKICFAVIAALALTGCAGMPTLIMPVRQPTETDYKPLTIKKEERITIVNVINLITNDIVRTGKIHLEKFDPPCAIDMFVSPKSFKLTLKTVQSREYSASVSGNLPVSIVVTPTLTIDNKQISTQQIDIPLDVRIKGDAPLLDAYLKTHDVTQMNNPATSQKVLNKSLLSIVDTYMSLPRAKGECARYPEPVVFTSTFQLEVAGSGELKALPIVTLDGKIIGTSDAYQTVEITYEFTNSSSGSALPAAAVGPMMVVHPFGAPLFDAKDTGPVMIFNVPGT